MARSSLPFAVADTSALARSLRKEFETLGRRPGHVELLNMLARAAGYSNFQHLRARAARPAARPGPVALPPSRAMARDRGRNSRNRTGGT